MTTAILSRRRPIGGRQYTVSTEPCEEDRQAAEAKARGVLLRVSGLRLTTPDDPDELPVFDGEEPGCLLDRRGS